MAWAERSADVEGTPCHHRSCHCQGRSQGEVARAYGVSQGWVSRLAARYRAEGEAAFEPRSRRPKTAPSAISAKTVDLIVRLRKELGDQGLDAGPDTICWHLAHHHQVRVSPATVARYLMRAGLVVPEPKKRPKSSYIRFAAEQPNECWQSDFTHYPLAGGTGTEILTWLDDHSRYALSVTAHDRVTGPIVTDAFRAAVAAHGAPASTLTDNGMVFTTRFSGGRGGRNGLEHALRRLGVTQKNGKPNHPQTQGKVERFQQTVKKWLRAQTPPARHPHPAPGAPGRLHRLLQHPAAPPLAAPPPDPGHRLPRPAQSRPRQPRSRHPRPRPHRQDRPHRHRHPPPRRQALPHRHRPDPRRNPRHPARPGPPRPHHRHRHRRTAPRPHPRPSPQLPAHSAASRTTLTPKEKPRTLTWVRGHSRCPERSHGGAGGIRTHTGRILSPVPLPLGYGPASALAAPQQCRKSDAELLAQPSDVARGLHRVLCLFDLPVRADYERRPDDAD